MNYGAIKEYDIADGPGVRVTLFVSGCRHHCEGCFQPETWNFQYGQPFTRETQEYILKCLQPSYISGLTLLGGEPMEPENQEVLLELVRAVRKAYPEKTIWCYSGYTFETDLAKGGKVYSEVTSELLSYLDVLVDGEFILEQRNISLQFRGSENQRLIDVQESRKSGQTVIWKG